MAQNKPEERQPLLKEENNQALLSMGTAEGEKKKGLPIRGKTLAVVCAILMTELCERLTYYSVIANLVLFCTSELELSSSLAATVSLVFSGTSYIIPVFGGYIADAVAGKYNTILGAGMLYLLGLFLIPASAVDYSAWFSPAADGTEYNLSVSTRRAYFLIGLAFVAIGTGGIKANVGPFGAQQVTDLGPEAVQSFFNWFYWFINAGSMVAYAGVAYIQQNISFSYGFLVPLISMIIALIIFVFAKKHYVITPPGGSIFGDAMGVIAGTGCKSFNRSRKSEGGKYSDEMVDGVIAVTRIIPIFLFFIMYWAVYSQMQSTFFLQSERMDVKIGHVVMPVAALNVFNTIIILVLIPIVDRGLYPCFAKMGMKLNHLHRIGIGMVLASLSVVVAGILEIYRKQELAESGGFNQTLSGDTFNASSYSVFLQVPEFALVGASEVFSSISGLEFAYSQAPDFMQGLVMGLFLLMSGLGNYVSNLILVIVQAFSKSDPWFPDEINEGKAEYLFFFIGGLMLLNFFGFVVAAKFYKYREFKRADDIEKEVEFTESENPKNPYMNGHDNLSYENSDVTKL